MNKFQEMTEVFKRDNLSMQGFVIKSFVRMDGNVWCFVEDAGGNWFISKQDDLREHRRIKLAKGRHY